MSSAPGPTGATWMVRHLDGKAARTAHLIHNGNVYCGSIGTHYAFLPATNQPRCQRCAATWAGEGTP